MRNPHLQKLIDILILSTFPYYIYLNFLSHYCKETIYDHNEQNQT